MQLRARGAQLQTATQRVREARLHARALPLHVRGELANLRPRLLGGKHCVGGLPGNRTTLLIVPIGVRATIPGERYEAILFRHADPLPASIRCACIAGRSSSGVTLIPILAIAPPAAFEGGAVTLTIRGFRSYRDGSELFISPEVSMRVQAALGVLTDVALDPFTCNRFEIADFGVVGDLFKVAPQLIEPSMGYLHGIAFGERVLLSHGDALASGDAASSWTLPSGSRR